MKKIYFEFSSVRQAYPIELTDGMDPIELCFNPPGDLCGLKPIWLCVSGDTDTDNPISFPENSYVTGELHESIDNFIRITAIKSGRAMIEIMSKKVDPETEPEECEELILGAVGDPIQITDNTEYSAFPGSQTCDDGTVVKVYTEGSGHFVNRDASLLQCISTDNALTWSSPQVLSQGIAGQLDWRDVELKKLADGTLVMNISYWTPQGQFTEIRRSTDCSASWTTTSTIDHGNVPFTVGLSRIVECPDGTLVHSYYTTNGCYIIRSADGGTNWSAPTLLSSIGNEVGLIYCSGKLLAFIRRTNDQQMLRAESLDCGATWAATTVTSISPYRGTKPDVWKGPDGKLYTSHRENDFNSAPQLAAISCSSDEGMTWVRVASIPPTGGDYVYGTFTSTGPESAIFLYGTESADCNVSGIDCESNIFQINMNWACATAA